MKRETFDIFAAVGIYTGSEAGERVVMARPKKGAELGATTQIGVRISEKMREALDKIANRNGRSISDEARCAIEAHVEAGGNARGARSGSAPVKAATPRASQPKRGSKAA